VINADLLHGLPPNEAECVLALGVRGVLTPGQELFHLGQTADSIYLVTRGRLRLTLPMQVLSRQENVLVEERSSGETVGWSGWIPPYRFSLSAAAVLETEVIAFSREALNRYFESHPETGLAVWQNLASIVGQRLHLFQAMWLREMQRMVEMRCA
jgi:CRP-like cAMP-binding protein